MFNNFKFGFNRSIMAYGISSKSEMHFKVMVEDEEIKSSYTLAYEDEEKSIGVYVKSFDFSELIKRLAKPASNEEWLLCYYIFVIIYSGGGVCLPWGDNKVAPWGSEFRDGHEHHVIILIDNRFKFVVDNIDAFVFDHELGHIKNASSWEEIKNFKTTSDNNEALADAYAFDRVALNTPALKTKDGNKIYYDLKCPRMVCDRYNTMVSKMSQIAALSLDTAYEMFIKDTPFDKTYFKSKNLREDLKELYLNVMCKRANELKFADYDHIEFYVNDGMIKVREIKINRTAKKVIKTTLAVAGVGTAVTAAVIGLKRK